MDEISKEKAYPSTSSCPHIPDIADWQMFGDVGHQMANYEKVLKIGLKGIKAEVEHYLAEVDQPYDHYSLREKKDFYKAVLITLDAAMAYAQRYADLAKRNAAKETNAKRKKELERIAEVCARCRSILPATGGKPCSPSG